MRPFEKSAWHLAAWVTAALSSAFAASGLTGCTPSIGDSCALSTDCASDGTRICDTSEPGGYCTVINCTGSELGSTCPDNAFCVLFNANVPGCPFSAYSPSRISQTQCRNNCNSDSDCRASYICALPTAPPWSAQILDPNQTLKACLPALSFVDGGISPENYGYDGALDAIPPVCQASGPQFDAGFPPVVEASAGNAGVDAPLSVDAAPPDSAAAFDAGASDGEAHDAGAHDATLGDATVHDAAAADASTVKDATPDSHAG